MTGKTIGHYRVGEKIGAGGMGVVYRATDTKLNRDVALKVLPEEFAKDHDRMARFKREAQVLASLNHPNIAAIYGLEEDGGKQALVLELVEGPTLAERIKQGAIPLDEALGIAKQIAEAIEAAHEQGIIHRDLKPANVKVKEDGQVKVLDFGLAKALEGESEADIENSPTLSIAATRAGVILGTAAYMSPEQARGSKVDKRTDIWAFGVVLYEMLTGDKLFIGGTISDVLASVLTREPDWEQLPDTLPASMRRLLRRCLTKDKRRRLGAISEALFAIEEYQANPQATADGQAPASRPFWQRALPWTAAALAVLSVFSLWSLWRATRPVEQRAIRLAVLVTETITPKDLQLGMLDLSPDGSHLVYVAREGDGQPQLFLRPLDQDSVTPLPNTEGATTPFFSPDGQWIGFHARGKLKKISLAGGPASDICDAAELRGASWGAGGTLVFAPSRRGGLSLVAAGGGTPRMLTTLDPGDTSHRWPQFLPNGRAVLFTVEKSAGVFGEASIDVITLDTKVRKTLVQGGTSGRYLPSGHILYLNGYTLLAVPFDIGRLEVTGSPLPVFDGVSASLTFGSGHFAVSSNGTLAYLPSSSAGKGKLVWVDRTGKVQLLMRTERELDFGAAENSMMRISSDGRRLALEPGNIGAYRRDVWIYEFQRDILNRLTFTEDNLYSIWSSDGRHVAFSSTRDGRALNLFWKPADGSGEAERLTRSDNLQVPYSFSPDGKWLAYFDSDPASGWDIWVLPMEGDNSSGPELRKPQVFLNSSFEETAPAFSPDGRWMAYGSDESGHEEIYVRPFPGPGARVQISSGGGRAPAWARNGRELFFSNSGKILAVSVTLSPDFRADTPTVLFEGNYHFIFDVAPDARRFAMIQFDEGESVPSTIHVVLNFFDELRRRVPTGN